MIAKGQMPVLAKEADNNIHFVYGSGDSIMYTYSQRTIRWRKNNQL